LADVARHAGADDVVPGAYAALAARHDVVQAQLRGRIALAAVLALVVVAREDVAAVELHRLLRQLVVVEQADDPRHLDLAVDGADPVIFLLAEVAGPVLAQLAPRAEVVGRELPVFQADHLGQFLAQQAERPPHGNDVHRHEHLVQDQYARLQGRSGAWTHTGPFFRVSRVWVGPRGRIARRRKNDAR